MVQRSSCSSLAKEITDQWNCGTKKSAYGEFQKTTNDKIGQQKSTKTQEKSNGGWGTFKNKDYFASLHHC